MRRFFLLGGFCGLPSVLAAQSPVELVPARATVVAGQEFRFTIRARDSAGGSIDSRQVVWLVGPGDVAAARGDGIVRTYRQGTAGVIARIGGKVAHAELIVLPKPPTTVELSADPAELVPGGIALVRAVPLTEDRDPLTDLSVGFSSSNPRVVTVDPSGAVVGLAIGEATVVAEARGARGEIRIRVVPNRVARLALDGPPSARTGDVVRFSVRATGRRGSRSTDHRSDGA
jgi:hypothetical protein